VKYLFKYVTKGPDCSKIYLERVRNGEDIPFDEETSLRNEVKEYLDCKYICEQDDIITPRVAESLIKSPKL
jgi:hypothetical protein